MNLFSYLCYDFFSNQKINITIILLLSLFFSFIYTNVFSIINANIIEGIQKNNLLKTFSNFKYFIGVSIIYIIAYYIYKLFQNHISVNLIHWLKSEIFRYILLANNENMSNANFVEFITPITRISACCSALLNDLISYVIPNITFLIVIFCYFTYRDSTLGLGFLLGNILIFFYLKCFWRDMFEYKQMQEEKTVENERYIIDSFNNIDKIIYRGQVQTEIDNFNEKTDECIDYSYKVILYITNHSFVINAFIYVIIILALFHMICLHFSKKMEASTFVIFLSMLIMYRDNISYSIQQVPEYVDSFGRINLVIQEFEKMVHKKFTDIIEDEKNKKNAKRMDLEFDTIVFKDVKFRYNEKTKYIFDNYNREVVLKDKIIGITGLSGNGKSSFVKLIMKLHKCNEGTIYIDGENIANIDSYYLRENITYVNQNSRLFDRKIVDNILYGCNDMDKCNELLREILTYPKIQELYRNLDLATAEAGPLGENLSGGQRQIANIISGLVNPTKILILDEPTNALDPGLKIEVLKILDKFRSYKKCIMIITHDKDVYPLFDEKIEI